MAGKTKRVFWSPPAGWPSTPLILRAVNESGQVREHITSGCVNGVYAYEIPDDPQNDAMFAIDEPGSSITTTMPKAARTCHQAPPPAPPAKQEKPEEQTQQTTTDKLLPTRENLVAALKKRGIRVSGRLSIESLIERLPDDARSDFLFG